MFAVDCSRKASNWTWSSGLFVRLLFPGSRMNFHTCNETCVKHLQAAAVTNLLCLLHNKVGEYNVAITETARGPNYINGTQAVTEQRNTLWKHVVILLCWLHLHQLISVKPKRPGQPSRLLFPSESIFADRWRPLVVPSGYHGYHIIHTVSSLAVISTERSPRQVWLFPWLHRKRWVFPTVYTRRPTPAVPRHENTDVDKTVLFFFFSLFALQ